MSATSPDHLQGFSLGLYSTWVYHKPFHVLFDAGEGLATALQNSVFGIRHVFLSHGHLDHIGGLPSLVNIRGNAMGDVEAPLTLVYPRDDPLLGMMRRYIVQSNPTLPYDLRWQPVRDGDTVALDDSRSVEVFPTSHVPMQRTLGYRVVEHRTRLRPSLRHLSPDEIRDLAQQHGRDGIQEPYDHPLLVYGGDGLPPEPDELAGADLALLDCTFLDEADRGRPTHATIDESVAAAAAGEVGTLVAMHVSGRYELADVRRGLRDAAARHAFEGELRLLWRGEMLGVEG